MFRIKESDGAIYVILYLTMLNRSSLKSMKLVDHYLAYQ